MDLWKMSAWKIFLAGGPIMWPILLCSVFGLAIILEKLLQLHSIKIDTGKFLSSLFDSLRRNKIKEAINHCDKTTAPIARILKAGILKYDRSRDEIEEAMEDASLYEIPRLEKKLNALATIAHISPLLGLLGTVTGMVRCFQTIQIKSASLNPVSPGDLAGGIWEALLTTVAGLIVAIPAYVAYNYLVSVINNIVIDIERASTELVNFFAQSSEQLKAK
ncbi:MAG: MotA/TolQ/ExbB proton channel family protein [Candidatus Omnitrophota bacterium]|nr:MotA/TolQ/ExbB proton channel family protein [Candidatus Omnitrophota bacterium]